MSNPFTTPEREALRDTVRQFVKRDVAPYLDEWERAGELPRELHRKAGELGLLGVPVFIFHEGSDPKAQEAFRQIAHLTRGACCPFDASSAQQLRDLLSAVAVYAAGGRAALEGYSRRAGGATLLLARQVKS